MRCKTCPNTTTQPRKHFCWLTWGICGQCALKTHPYYYSATNEINGLKNRRVTIVKRIAKYSQMIENLQKELVTFDDLIGKKRAEKELGALTQTEAILKANLNDTTKKKRTIEKILRPSY